MPIYFQAEENRATEARVAIARAQTEATQVIQISKVK